MFECISADSVLEPSFKQSEKVIFEVDLAPGQHLIQELYKRRRNIRLQFLILLRESDYHKCFFSYRDMIAYRKNNFPGDLILEKYEDCDQLPYYIKEPSMPRQLYIMLPKERTFIPSNTFTETYIRSKMRELIQIFVKLNAKTVKFVRYDTESELEDLKLEATAMLSQVQVSSISRIEHENAKYSGMQYEMRFQPNTTPFSIDDFLDDRNYYYLKHETGWQDIIRRRVDYHMGYDKYTYKNNETKLLKGKFVSKLKVLDMVADYDWEKFKEFTIEYEIEYYPKLIGSSM